MKARHISNLLAATLGSLVFYLAIAGIGKAQSYRHRFPHWWYLQAVCIHRHESTDWRAATGNGYFGGFQFLPSTWRRAGGSGLPNQWAPNEQYFRAWRIWTANGGSWREWSTRSVCGVA